LDEPFLYFLEEMEENHQNSDRITGLKANIAIRELWKAN
jgi:hypothetical protein